MTPEQFSQLLDILNKISTNQPYTITGAADWPILVVVGGALIGIIVFMWMDLRASIKDGRVDWRDALKKHEDENEKSFDMIWQAHRDCQADCCPRGNGGKKVEQTSHYLNS